MKVKVLNTKTLAIGVSAMCVVAFSTGCFDGDPNLMAAVDGAPAARCVSAENAALMADQVLQLVNLERAEAGLPPVVVSPILDKLAADYACRMIDESFFGHEDPATGHGPGQRAVACEYSFYAVGENLAAGQESAAEVMRVWMESPSHKAVILDDRWTQVGIAVRTGGEHAVYWVQEFGEPADE